MYYVDYESSMEKGSFYIDHSKHFYNGRLGYEWTSKDFAGKLHKGVERDKERALAIAERMAFKH